ncbi:ribonuclease HI [Galbibacter sp. EGI 63066]|uniref:ribonuclease HI n=1 Tax=Galbibacter sp. EGI 63066 TaxID=2993559 RepID=UPI0022498669|nr:ribonuclease HI [Galbibacter sp. EGI 63066]MCX2678858.1 ribonuclease HI [Galbibacter sp. EGI 63066]
MTKFDVHIYTDGASRGNPGPGGYGIVMEWVGKPYKKEFSKGFKKTTNNRMELMAVTEALKKLKRPNTTVKVFSDSKYVVDAVTKKWVFGWEKKNFKDKKNPDLWIDFLKEYRKQKVHFQWIKGHNNHPQNERCDFLAVEASKKPNLKTDNGFENNIKPLL